MMEEEMSRATRMLGETFEDGRRALAFFGEGKSVPTVSVFGSSRLPSDDAACRMARLFGEEMASAGIRVLAGGRESLMGQVLEGARELGVPLTWKREELPEDPVQKRGLRFLHLSMRKRFFLWPSRAIVLFPGGYGTLDELFELLALRQTESWARIPAFCAEVAGRPFWEPFWETLDRVLRSAPFLDREAECPLPVVREVEELSRRVKESVFSWKEWE